MKKFKQLFAAFLFTLLLIFCHTNLLVGQENKVISQEDNNYDSGVNYFDLTNYAQSSVVLNGMADQPPHHPLGNYEKLRREALLTAQIADLRIEDPSAETKLTYYIQQYYPDPVTIQPILELASHYYYNRNYQEAIDWYERVPIEDLPELDKSEASFKKGYCHFVKKEFSDGMRDFGRVKDVRNLFYYPNNYYYGMCQYFSDDYDGAVKSFKAVSSSVYYGDYIPYYLCQIYFAQSKYDLLLSYGEQKITESAVKNKKEIRLLLGQAYYVRGDYDRALTHLEFYEANTEKLTIEEFYQLAFTQYKLGKYEKAKSNFLELTYQDSKLGQLSNYYLADCYVKTSDRASARAVFKKVSQMEYDKGMQQEALFNYGKISAEQGYEREAINIFIDIKEDSPYYAESQDVIYDILVNSGDYANSINIMESLPRLTPKLKSTYQNLSLKKAIQFYSEGDFENARTFFDKSLIYPNERLYLAQTNYWLGKMAYDAGELNKTIDYISKYHEIANGLNDLPEESANYMASYLKAYAHLKLREYDKAEIQFKNAIVGLNLNSQDIQSEYLLNRVLPDAFVRAGDCLFKQRKYNDAKNFYNQSVSRKQAGFIYALYQRGLIEGLINEPYQKLVTMREITTDYPSSEYADDAYMQIGETYLSLGSTEPAAIAFIDVMAKFGPTSPYYSQAQLRMGLINYNRGDLPKALDYYKSVFNHNPTSKQKMEAMKAIEEIYVKDMGNSYKYFKYLDSIPGFELTAYTKDSLTYFIGYNQYVKGEYDRALDGFNTYIQRYVGGFYRLEARFYRGEIFSINKNYDKALADYEYLIKEKGGGNYKKALWKSALISYNHAENFGKALDYYKTFEGLTDNKGDQYQAQLGALRSAYKISRDTDITLFANKVNENSLATTDERSVALFYLGKIAFRNNNNEQALAAFGKVSKMVNNSQSAESKYRISEIYYKQGQFDLAEKQCNFNNETSLNYPYWVAKSILLLSDIYINKNDLINARAAIEAVLENFKDDASLQKDAKQKLIDLEVKEGNANRVKINNPNLLELDSTGGN